MESYCKKQFIIIQENEEEACDVMLLRRLFPKNTKDLLW